MSAADERNTARYAFKACGGDPTHGHFWGPGVTRGEPVPSIEVALAAVADAVQEGIISTDEEEILIAQVRASGLPEEVDDETIVILVLLDDQSELN